MWNAFVGYINFEKCMEQIKENKLEWMEKVFHSRKQNFSMYKYDFYKQKLKNILYEYCDDVFEENDDIYFDMTKSQYLYDQDSRELLEEIVSKISEELDICLYIGASFHKDLAKWIYHNSPERYKILNYRQAKTVFGKDMSQKMLEETLNSQREIVVLPKLFGEENQLQFTDFNEAFRIAQSLSLKLVNQLKEKDYGMRKIQIQFYDSHYRCYLLEENLRNFTNVNHEIQNIIWRLLESFVFQDIYSDFKLIFSDFIDLQEKQILYAHKNVSTIQEKWSLLKNNNLAFLKNHFFFEKTV